MQASFDSVFPSASASPLRWNLAWMTFGNIAQAAAQWGIVVVLARLGSPHDVGAYALALAIVSPVFLFSNMHLRTLLATDIARHTETGNYLTLRVTASATATAFLFVGALAQASPQGLALVGLTVVKAFETISELLYGEMQRSEQMDRIGRSMIARWGGSLVATALVMYWSHSLLGCLTAMAAISAAVAAVDMQAVRASCRWSTWENVGRLAASAAPLGLLMLMVSLNASIPRYFLAGWDSPSAVGIFAALSYISIALNTLVIATGQAAGTAMARSFWLGNRSSFMRQASKLIALALTLGLGGIGIALWCGKSILLLLYGVPFAAESKSFLWLMLAGALSYVVSALGYLLAAARCYYPQLPTLVLASACTAACCWVWIPTHGVSGAAMAQSAGYGLQLVLSIGLLGYCTARRFR
ncbi:MAG: hypothetical protein JNK48_20950 [Bryobacterales bacterium]|nr:hypothetical protein [Bryobacterales bacterium]